MAACSVFALAAAVFLPRALATPPSNSTQAGISAMQLATELNENHHPGITAFLLTVNGERLASYNHASLVRHPPDLRSATKSITALLVGIALERGYIPSIQSRVADLLPEYRGILEQDPRKAAITVEDLLTMRSGLDCDDWTPGSPGHEDTMYEQGDWLAFWAAVPARDPPGTRFSYCTGNVIALGAIVARVSGSAVDQFAESALFGPLGITGARWETFNSGKGVDSGGHLRLQPAELEKIGELVLAEGLWGDLQIVSARWITAMTTAHTPIPERKQRYGYLWWVDETSQPDLPKTRLLIAWGNGGNFLVVMPEVRAVATFAGTRFNQPDALEPLIWLRDRVLPTLPLAAPTHLPGISSPE
jgi:CubicO group peptidase (beta-lactamase class C family)